MAYSFPKAGTFAARRVGTYTKELLANPASIPTFDEARTSARNWLKATQSGATGLYSTCLLDGGDIAIVLFGKRDMQRVIWNFGRA